MNAPSLSDKQRSECFIRVFLNTLQLLPIPQTGHTRPWTSLDSEPLPLDFLSPEPKLPLIDPRGVCSTMTLPINLAQMLDQAAESTAGARSGPRLAGNDGL